jgi:hypothetical protein
MLIGMNRLTLPLALAVLAVASSPAAEQLGERLENETAGIAVVRPAGWHTTSLDTVQENRNRVRLADPELQRLIQTRATAPLFVFSKYAEPYPGLNPSIQITLRPSGSLAGQPPTALLRMALGTMRRALPDFQEVTPIANARVSGLAAAHVRGKYTLQSKSGESYRVVTRLWLAPRGAFMFLIGMSGPADGPDASEEEFRQALASVEIQK